VGRETLAEAFFEFVDVSYAAGQAAKDHFHARRAGDPPDRLQVLADRCEEELAKLIPLQTKIRLLAPARTLDAAKGLRVELTRLRGSLGDDTAPETHRRLVTDVAKARGRFVDLAKAGMSLPR
jgi:hypothetical protein